MGKITVSGLAKRRISTDVMTLNLRFKDRAKSAEKALASVREQCEDCLRELTEMGIDMRSIRIEEDQISQFYDEEKLEVRASKEIVVELEVNMVLINVILDKIQNNNYGIELEVDYRVNDLSKIYNELLKEAIIDSKNKAEIIAETMNQKIVGIDSVEMSSYLNDIEIPCFLEREASADIKESCTPLSDKLEPPIQEETKSVTVVWLIE